VSVLSKWAKYGVLAMVIADAAGILIVHNRLNRPAVSVPSISEDVPMAMNDTASPLPKDAALVIGDMATIALTKDNLQANGAVAQNNFQALPAVSRMDPMPAPMRIEPLTLEAPQASRKVAREMQMALRAPVIQKVRIAELYQTHNAKRTFSSAFSNDIGSSSLIRDQSPTAGFAATSPGNGAVNLSTSVDVRNRATAMPPEKENTAVPMQVQPEVPVPEFGSASEVPQPQIDSQPVPAAPDANAPSAGEIPAS
jgi:hypothetical protein